MKPAPDNRLAYGLRMMKTYTRVRNFRGHNVHSPFAYSVIRNVIVPRKLSGGDDALFREARDAGLPRRAAIQLQNLRNHCAEHQLVIIPENETPQSPATARSGKTIRCIVHPRVTKERFGACKKLIAAHSGMSIDSGRYVLLFDDDRLTKRHYRL